MIPQGCTEQAFESGLLGRPVWRLDAPERAGAAIAAAGPAGIGLIHHRGPARRASLLESHGFRHVGTLVTLEGPGPDRARLDRARLDRAWSDRAWPGRLRDAAAADADAVEAIARAAFRFDRWHADPRIPAAAADAYKAQWARNDVTGRADAVLLAVAEDGTVQGFNALLCRPPAMVIDLLAVAPAHRGRGVGRRLMAGAFAAARRTGIETVRVGTQAANQGSIRLYRAVGLKEVARAETWHWIP